MTRPVAIAPSAQLDDYRAAVQRVGGLVRVLDPAVDAPSLLPTLAGALLLPGGRDLAPVFYGQRPHAAFAPSEPGRDDYELALADAAWAHDLPLLGICRGLQVLAVARGAPLLQHLPADVGTTVPHAGTGESTALAHEVSVVEGTLLHRLLEPRLRHGAMAVNSRHHQAPASAGHGLVVSAVAPDGVIEALEAPGQRFCLGVGWHPESFHRTGEFDGLFAGLVRALR